MDRLFGRCAAVFVLAVVALAGCMAKYPVVGKFTDHNEVFLGTVDHDLLAGVAFIDVKAKNSGMSCSGSSRVAYVPASNRIAGAFLIPYCTGQRGTARLSCDDGRQIDATWTAKSCSSGHGRGQDQHGARFEFTFGLTEAEAQAEFEKNVEEVAAKPELPVYRPKETREEEGFSVGTGFFISETGHLLTNFHVIEDADSVSVVIDGAEREAIVLKQDPANDIAMIKIDADSKPLKLGKTGQIRRADDVLTLGFPLITIQGQEQKASFGRINALSGIRDDVRFMQIDVPIQPGNSGGPLIARNGAVIGIVTMTLHQIVTLMESGALPQNVNYAVKSDYVLPIVEGVVQPVSAGETRHEFTELVEEYADSVVLVVAR